MSLRSNFKQAINELSGSDPKKDLPAEQAPINAQRQSPVQADNRPVSAVVKSVETHTQSASEDSKRAAQPVQTPAAADPAAADRSQNAETAVITADTQIHGAIVTKSPLIIKGKVKGNILCEETVRLSGEIEGNVTSMSIEVKGATIKGDLRMKYTAILEEGSRLSGNLEAESAVINGSVEGDMRIHGNLRIMSHSRINGDIFAGSLEIDKGAVVNGKVSVVAEDDKSQMPENKPAAAKETNSSATTEAAKPAPKIAPTPANNSNNPIKP